MGTTSAGPALAGAVSFDGFTTEMARHARGYAIASATRGLIDEVRFELRPGDCAKPDDCVSHRERVELSEDWRAPLEAEIWYRFRLLLPADYPEASPKQILGQWHDGRYPVLSNRYELGAFWFDLMTRKGTTTSRFPLTTFKKGAWNELVYAVRWSDADAGRLRIWHDGRLAVDHRGATLIRGTDVGPRLKLGIYRSDVDKAEGPLPTQVVVFDDYRRQVAVDG